ncbi:hypothetical protein DC915_RS02890 [Vibrio parahaemolyticus]|nr:hypothetical protein [Vibrio parahaemolyticus]EJG0009925.1 hypothetical protein [Vibrio parahaemolyticus]
MKSYTKLDVDCINMELLVSLCREYAVLGKTDVVYANTNGVKALYVGHSDVLRRLDELRHVEFGCADSALQLDNVWKVSGAVDAIMFVSILNLVPYSRLEFTDSHMLIRTEDKVCDVSAGGHIKGVSLLKFIAFTCALLALMSSAAAYRTLTEPRSENEPSSRAQLKAQEFRSSIAELEKLEEFEDLSIDISPKD